MATTLWDTTGSEVVKALLAERRAAGALASGLALTLVAVVDERRVQEAEQAATIAAAAHPCRLVLVIRHSISTESRLDAEVQIGGRLGSTEAVVMRMHGRLGLHAESVVLPLLAPDAPVVTWWHGPPPAEIATDALGVLANRRITDCSLAPTPMAALQKRATDFVPGDTDLVWTRATPWRALLASALDGVEGTPVSAAISAAAGNATAALLAGWLGSRLDVATTVDETGGPGITGAQIVMRLSDGEDCLIRIERPDGASATFTRGNEDPRVLPLPRRELGDLLAEELRRMDPDPVYSEALARSIDLTIDSTPRSRILVWRDPALADQ
ncbi:MAG TPA: glucose-6-phosphate dehydrogenase assembly protein OpcA [Mycobacteriales bacterium]|nr:glucose-6-phosphate dehydrogenase assembly protein OpcA [Mycobacteriales bacterium]